MTKRKHVSTVAQPVKSTTPATRQQVKQQSQQQQSQQPQQTTIKTSDKKKNQKKYERKINARQLKDQQSKDEKIVEKEEEEEEEEEEQLPRSDGEEEEEEELLSSESSSEGEDESDYDGSSSELEYESDLGLDELDEEQWNAMFSQQFNQKEEEDQSDEQGDDDKDEKEEDDDDKNVEKTHDEDQIVTPLFDSGNESADKQKKRQQKTKAKDQVKNDLVARRPMGMIANIQNEYEYDSSDEEDLRNTIGNIPINMYDNLQHVGYDHDARKIAKPAQDDQIDNFLNKMDDPDYFRTVFDATTGQKIVLTDEDLAILSRIRKGKYPDPNYDPYKPFIDFFSHEQEIHPVTHHPLSKAHFIPSLAEKKLINKLVMKIRRARRLAYKDKDKKKDTTGDRSLNFNFDLWSSEHEPSKWYKRLIPAKKPELPGHVESYNPPPEYLFTEEEKQKWLAMEPEERRLQFIPQKFEALRKVPQYGEYLKERFERCMELYLAPRSRRQKAQFRPEDLLPNLPKPSELRPYPTVESIRYEGHTDRVNSIAFEPSGQLFASASLDGQVKIWEVLTGRCMHSIELEEEIKCVTWCPNKSLLLANGEHNVYLINPSIANKNVNQQVDELFSLETGPAPGLPTKESPVEWSLMESDSNEWKKGVRAIIRHKFAIKQVTWHHKGDYFASVMPNGKHRSVVIHQLSKRQSQVPFKKSKGLVQKVLFHPTKPFFFVATQRFVRVYNLVKQELAKKLVANCKYISSMAVHPQGDNVLIGSFDNKLGWFDLDMSGRPYKNLKYHTDSVRQVAFHPSRYPLFASASNDGKVIVAHGRVYDDLMQNALIVPVKTLMHGGDSKKRGVYDVAFHPLQPWLITAGEDSMIRLFS